MSSRPGSTAAALGRPRRHRPLPGGGRAASGPRPPRRSAGPRRPVRRRCGPSQPGGAGVRGAGRPPSRLGPAFRPHAAAHGAAPPDGGRRRPVRLGDDGVSPRSGDVRHRAGRCVDRAGGPGSPRGRRRGSDPGGPTGDAPSGPSGGDGVSPGPDPRSSGGARRGRATRRDRRDRPQHLRRDAPGLDERDRGAEAPRHRDGFAAGRASSSSPEAASAAGSALTKSAAEGFESFSALPMRGSRKPSRRSSPSSSDAQKALRTAEEELADAKAEALAAAGVPVAEAHFDGRDLAFLQRVGKCFTALPVPGVVLPHRSEGRRRSVPSRRRRRVCNRRPRARRRRRRGPRRAGRRLREALPGEGKPRLSGARRSKCCGSGSEPEAPAAGTARVWSPWRRKDYSVSRGRGHRER